MNGIPREPLSPYNQTITGSSGPVSVSLREITLRQLGHMDGDLLFAEKLYFLSQLAAIGVTETVVWGVDDDAADLVRASRELGIGINIAFFGKVYFKSEMESIFDKARACGATTVCFVGRGPESTLSQMGWTRGQMLSACVDSVKSAKDRGLRISIGLSYATQTDRSYLQEVSGAVEAAGADVLQLPDSLGVASPDGMRNLVSAVREVVQMPIEVHCHNDFGLAVANSVASVQAGATTVEVVVNGMDPERSGVTALEEVVVALELLYGCHLGINLEGLVELSRLHQAMTNTTVAENKPVVGERAFNYRVAPGKKGSEPKRDQFYSSPTANPFDPRLVGNTRAFFVGKFSGPNEVSERLGQLGLECTDSELLLLTGLVSDRGRSSKRAVTNDDFCYLHQVAKLASSHPSSRVDPRAPVSVPDARG